MLLPLATSNACVEAERGVSVFHFGVQIFSVIIG